MPADRIPVFHVFTRPRRALSSQGRPARACPNDGGGAVAQEATTITLPPNGEQIQVRTLPEATEQELVDVRQNASGLHLQFDHVGQVDLSAVTAQNQGRILVVLINGYIVYAPIIDEQITNGELDIPHPINPQVILLLQEVARRNVRQAAKT